MATVNKLSLVYNKPIPYFSRKKKGLIFSIVLCGILFKYSFHSIDNGETSKKVEKEKMLMTKTPQCWLKDAYDEGSFTVYSHRSFVSNAASEQPTCQDALSQLHKVDINHLDLDLVLDISNNDDPKIYVSHPMEFKKESSYYSPCSLTLLKDLIGLLNDEYGAKNWFISLEPKASWGRTEKEINDVALVEPLQIMTHLLKLFEENGLTNDQCAVIVDVDTLQGDDEKEKFRQLLTHCQLFVGKRKTDTVHDTLDMAGFRYDKIMPTIEFHPKHEGNIGLTVPSNINKDSVFWVVDNPQDLMLAATLKPDGIVSNKPEEIVSTIKSRAWCMGM